MLTQHSGLSNPFAETHLQLCQKNINARVFCDVTSAYDVEGPLQYPMVWLQRTQLTIWEMVLITLVDAHLGRFDWLCRLFRTKLSSKHWDWNSRKMNRWKMYQKRNIIQEEAGDHIAYGNIEIIAMNNGTLTLRVVA